jgi:sugar lactone lactonase YvrE
MPRAYAERATGRRTLRSNVQAGGALENLRKRWSVRELLRTKVRAPGLGVWNLFGIWSLGIGTFVLGGCATRERTQPTTPPPSSFVWPAPPEEPRIQFVQQVARPGDVGVKASAFKRFSRWLTGSNKGNEGLVKPFGIALDEADNLCFTDTGANTVSYYDRASKKWQSWNKIGKTSFSSPVAVVKRHQTFYVADSGLGSVLGFDERGKLLLQITNHLERPSGLAILNEQLFVADSARHCVVVFTLYGVYQTEFGRRGVGPREFNFPTHLGSDGQSMLFVTDSMNGRVQMLDAAGNFKGQVGSMGDSPGYFSRPKGVAADGFGNVYVVDSLFDNIQIFDRGGRLLLNMGEAGSEPGQFWLPNGIAISRQNEIFVSDSYNHRIQVFKYIGPL